MAEASTDDWLAIERLFIRYATALDHGDVEAVPAEPVGEGGTGDAGAGDEDGLVAHAGLPDD